MTDLAYIDIRDASALPTGRSAAVIGPFGAGDAGSEASLAGLLNGLNGIEPVVTSAAPDLTIIDHGVEALDFFDRRAVSRTVAVADGVVVINPVLTPGDSNLSRLARLTLRARLSGKPVALVGVSAWGLNNAVSRMLARTIVHNSDLVLVRDEASADVLAAAGIEPPFRMGADLAWAQMDDLYAAKEPADQVVVAIDLTGKGPEVSVVESNLVEALGPVAASGLDVLLQPWGTDVLAGSNRAVADNVARRLGSNVDVIDAPSSLKEARDSYSGSRVVLALKLHAVMAAACAGSRALALGTDPAFQRLTQALDLPHMNDLTSPGLVSEALLRAAEGSPADNASVRSHIDRAKGSIELVRLLLTEGADAPSMIDPLPLYPNPWRA